MLLIILINHILLSIAMYAGIAIPPRITAHPQELKDAVPDKFAMLTVQATGTEPLKYQWEHELGYGSGEWQLCDVERFPGANSSTLIIPSVQKSDEGSYRCIVSNLAGWETSESATLTVGELNLTTRSSCKLMGRSASNKISEQV